MEQKRNYQKELEKIIEANQKNHKIPTLLLHGCCAPCSSYCLWYLSEFFKITLFYYNPNIFPESEYDYRVREVKRLLENLPVKHPVTLVEGAYEPERFFNMAKGMEELPEGQERCFRCYELRLREAAEYARREKFDYFTTTLSISPHKNTQKLNEIGEKLEKEYGIHHLPSDFKKKGGYLKSIEFSREYELYRQNFCGCVYSKKAAEKNM